MEGPSYVTTSSINYWVIFQSTRCCWSGKVFEIVSRYLVLRPNFPCFKPDMLKSCHPVRLILPCKQWNGANPSWKLNNSPEGCNCGIRDSSWYPRTFFEVVNLLSFCKEWSFPMPHFYPGCFSVGQIWSLPRPCMPYRVTKALITESPFRWRH